MDISVLSFFVFAEGFTTDFVCVCVMCDVWQSQDTDC